ncbi:class F sortase [Streptomyces sp. NBC_00344]|uniref:class F sortase n=1 Tax=Streptomyces sp. NBC_00344 TaxID=2975720 RepID=UPI002E1C2360
MTAQKSPEPTTPPRTASKPMGRALLWPAAAAALGALLMYNSVEGTGGSEPRPAAVASAAPTPAAPVDETLVLPRSAPMRLSIPSIAVDAPFTTLTLDSKGQLNPPPGDDNNLVGWYKGGASPGESGPAIVAGHVDTKTGPAVFQLLYALTPGNTVQITREDGVVATFVVDSVEEFSKADFPDDRVYADTPTPQLRLITCGGVYDHQAKDYSDNVVVFAHLDSTSTG